MNSVLKHLAERALIGSGVELLSRRGKTEETIVLAYHNIVPTGKPVAGDSSLHLPQSEFCRQLDFLSRTHEVVPLQALCGDAPPAERPRVVITFDDAYAGALTVGVEELVRRGMPATIFVVPALLGAVSWWDNLADPDNGALEETTRRHALASLGGRSDSILRWAGDRTPPTRVLPQIGSESQLDAIASAPGITLGSHTWSHTNLTALSWAELESELTLPLNWLKTRFRSFLPWLTYPYGLFNEQVEKATARAGYVGAFRIDGGWLPQRVSLPSFALPRFNVSSGLSLEGFRLRLAGIGPGV